MTISLSTQLVVCLISIYIVSRKHAVQDKISIDFIRHRKTSADNVTFVTGPQTKGWTPPNARPQTKGWRIPIARPQTKGWTTPNTKKQETRRMILGENFLQSGIAKQENDTCDMDENKVKNSLTVSVTNSTVSTGSKYQTDLEESMKLSQTVNGEPPPALSQGCPSNIGSVFTASKKHPCGKANSRININFLCGLSCVVEDGKTSCEVFDCNGTYQCRRQAHIPLSKLCDGHPDCKSEDDEILCRDPKRYYCNCIGVTIQCNPWLSRNKSSNHAIPFGMEFIRMSLSKLNETRSIQQLSFLIMRHCSHEQFIFVTELIKTDGFSDLAYIYISNSDLASNTSVLIISGLSKLEILQLSDTGITSLSANVFKGLPLHKIDLSSNRIYSLPVGIFHDLPLRILNLSSNSISDLPLGIFHQLSMFILDLSSNKITSLPEGVFQGLSVELLDLSSNMISYINVNVFNGISIFHLNLAFNRITSFHENVFSGLRVSIVTLSFNRISSLSAATFRGLTVTKLTLRGNRISFLPVNLFKEIIFRSRAIINLSLNNISSIPIYLFKGMTLNNLDISSNSISSLPEAVFRGLNCTYLSLADNGLIDIRAGSFRGITFLKVLVLNKNKLKITKQMFQNLDNLTHLIVDDYMLCCVKPKSVSYGNCLASSDNQTCIGQSAYGYVPEGRNCSAPSSAISSCTAMIGSVVLRISLWIIGLAALVGNIGVIIYRLSNEKESLKKCYSIFVLNLSLSDVLMGVYLLIIGGADLYYRGVYAWNDQKWRHSTLCITAGILSTISSEMSTFIILLISIDRFIVLVFPFTHHRIIWRQAVGISFALWIIAFVLAMIPQVTFESYFKGEFYSVSGVCLALPLTGDVDGAEYSVFVFVGLNSVIFVVIMVGHILICKSISSSIVANTQTRRRDIAVAKTLFLVVLTDFCCWVPIGIMGILSQAGIHTPDDIYSWVMIFVLPINSAINPFIYTFISVWRKRKEPSRARTAHSRVQSHRCLENTRSTTI